MAEKIKPKTTEKKVEKKKSDLSSPQREAPPKDLDASKPGEVSIRSKSESEKTNKVKPKPLPVDKEKAREIEAGMKEKKAEAKPEEKSKEKKDEKPTGKKDSGPEDKTKAKKEEKKKEPVKITKKEEAIARGAGLPVSKKQSMYLCNFIKNKKIDDALADLDRVTKMKKAVPFKGEIPHRKGPGSSGRYPIKACGHFINMLKALKGNVITNQMELEETKICLASASWANRPMRRGGRSAKRTNVILKAKEFPEKAQKKTTKSNKGKK